MTNLAEQFQPHRQAPTVSNTVMPATDTSTVDAAVSPQDFYLEMVQRPDVRRILTRLAQVEDGNA